MKWIKGSFTTRSDRLGLFGFDNGLCGFTRVFQSDVAARRYARRKGVAFEGVVNSSNLYTYSERYLPGAVRDDT